MPSNNQLDDKVLQQFMTNFYGYGNYKSRYWFVGMEEGGGNSAEELQTRLSVWAKRGARELEDLKAYHLELGIDQWFKHPVKSQSTWNKLIRVVMSAQQRPPTLDEVKNYQSLKLGALNGDTALLELLPLPSPSTAHWLYSALSAMPELVSRSGYSDAFVDARVRHLQSRIAEFKPRAVIFYGMSYLSWWQQIAVVPLTERQFEGNTYFEARSKDTHYFVSAHPVSHGVTMDYFHYIGALLK